jgi:hypothetical protein
VKSVAPQGKQLAKVTLANGAADLFGAALEPGAAASSRSTTARMRMTSQPLDDAG